MSICRAGYVPCRVHVHAHLVHELEGLRRRAQRIARSRLGVENTADPEFDVTPARLRRPGAAVLEIDDEDPEFEHLEHVAFARHYDLPRAAGQ